MKTKIDTIKEDLEAATDNLSYYDGFDIARWNKALAALSTLDPGAKLQEPSEDLAESVCLLTRIGKDLHGDPCVILNADGLAALITAHDDAIRREAVATDVRSLVSDIRSADPEWRDFDLDDAQAYDLITAHDDAIRREACRAIRAEFKVSEGGSDTIDRACATILGTEPAREESL